MSGPSLSVVCFPCVICQYVYDDDVIVVVFRLCYFVVSLSQFVSCVHNNVVVVEVVVGIVVVVVVVVMVVVMVVVVVVVVVF